MKLTPEDADPSENRAAARSAAAAPNRVTFDRLEPVSYTHLRAHET